MTREENITMSEIDYKAVQIEVLEFDNADVIVTSECKWVDCSGFVCNEDH